MNETHLWSSFLELFLRKCREGHAIHVEVLHTDHGEVVLRLRPQQPSLYIVHCPLGQICNNTLHHVTTWDQINN